MKNRIQFNDAGYLVEVVTDGGAHLERLARHDWFLRCERADGTALAIWFTGRITMTKEQESMGNKEDE